MGRLLLNAYLLELKQIDKGIQYCNDRINEATENWIKKEFELVKEDRKSRKLEILNIFINVKKYAA